jgi:hypothetical protein
MGGTEPAGDCKLLYGNRDPYHHRETGFSAHKGTISVVKRVDFVTDRKSHVILKGSLCDIIVLNVHAPAEVKYDDIKDNFYEEPELVFLQFSEYNMKIC